MPATQLGTVSGLTVLGGGTAFPRRRLSNADVLRLGERFGGDAADAERVAFAAAGIEERLGLRERAWAHVVGTPLDPAREEDTLSLGVAAARAALEDARVPASALALVLCATSTPPRLAASLAGAVGAALGADAACMDTRAGCAGALFGLATAALYVHHGAGPVLLVGVDTFSKLLPLEPALGRLSLGDGAGALVLGAGSGTLRAAFLRSDGRLAHVLQTDGALPPTADELARGAYQLAGDPDALAALLPERYAEALGDVLGRGGVPAEAIDLFVPHQTTRPTIAAVAAAAGLRPERTYVNVERHANIGAGGWVAALVEARAEGRVPAGAHVALAAVGGGMSWGAAVLRC